MFGSRKQNQQFTELPTRGVDDLPIDPLAASKSIKELDRLGISSYYTGLAGFIRECVAPMTIAVQGQWGSGKTSALYCIKSELENRSYINAGTTPIPPTKVSYVNTWQYAVLDLEENLVFSVVNRILASLTPNAGEIDSGIDFSNLQELFNETQRLVMKWSAKAITLGAAFNGVDLTNLFDSSPTKIDYVEELTSLREKFAHLVEEFCRHGHYHRVVFLIDDLDRLEPQRAVELLEVMKILFDVPKAVFVLAIDFDIVQLGVRAKYGQHDDSFDRWKARSFFDKIVQVPFNMPTTAYDTKALIDELKGNLTNRFKESEQEYIKIAIDRSVGVNPRAIKRLFNAFTLSSMISDAQLSASKKASLDHYGLFLFLCLELAFPATYKRIVDLVSIATSRGEELSSQGNRELAVFFDSNEPIPVETLSEIGEPDHQHTRIQLFLELMTEHFSDSDGKMEWDSLLATVLRSAVTSTDSSVGRDEEEEVQNSANLEFRMKKRGLYNNPNKPPALLLFEKAATEYVNKHRDKCKFPIIFAGLGDILDTRYSCYFGDDLQAIQAQARRNRTRFLDLRQTKNSLAIGLAPWDRDVQTELNPDLAKLREADPYEYAKLALRNSSDYWLDVVEKLIEDPDIPLLQSSRTGSDFGFTIEGSISPIQIKGIRTPHHVEIVLKHFDEFYEAALKDQPELSNS